MSLKIPGMPDLSRQVELPASDRLAELCERLRTASKTLDSVEDWPGEQLALAADAGVFRWFVPQHLGGTGWNPCEIAEGYRRLGANCLTTTFVITQWVAAVTRIVSSENEALQQRLLPDLIAGKTHITVGISHLTTSRRHLANPVLSATETEQGFRLQGFSPWVTAAPNADFFLIGATMQDQRQVLLVVSSDSPGVAIQPSQSLVALSASRTGSVKFEDVFVPAENLVAGPAEAVLKTSKRSGTGGVQTSTLALALASSAIDFVVEQSADRTELSESGTELKEQWQVAWQNLLSVADGSGEISNEQLRTDANSLALRSTQAAMVAAKGAGFVNGHPVGRWCQEALFFLVWSCPPAVSTANLCELAGIQS